MAKSKFKKTKQPKPKPKPTHVILVGWGFFGWLVFFGFGFFPLALLDIKENKMRKTLEPSCFCIPPN